MDTKLKEAVARVREFLDAKAVHAVIADAVGVTGRVKLWGDDLIALVDGVEQCSKDAGNWAGAFAGEEEEVARLREALKAHEAKLPTDLSKRLREWADTKPMALDYANIMRNAAAEIDVYYGGMLAWKRTAQKKDGIIIEQREQLKAKEVALEAAHARLLELEHQLAQCAKDAAKWAASAGAKDAERAYMATTQHDAPPRYGFSNDDAVPPSQQLQRGRNCEASECPFCDATVAVPACGGSAEQQARDMLERLGHREAQSLTAGDVAELANLIATTGNPGQSIAKDGVTVQAINDLARQHGNACVSSNYADHHAYFNFTVRELHQFARALLAVTGCPQPATPVAIVVRHTMADIKVASPYPGMQDLPIGTKLCAMQVQP